MTRRHIIEETIHDRVHRGAFIAWLQSTGVIPKEWDRCSIKVAQRSESDEIEIEVKYSIAKPAK